jgi:hypothetical protein
MKNGETGRRGIDRLQISAFLFPVFHFPFSLGNTREFDPTRTAQAYPFVPATALDSPPAAGK